VYINLHILNELVLLIL